MFLNLAMTSIFALEASLLWQIFVLRTPNFRGATITDSSSTETLHCLNLTYETENVSLRSACRGPISAIFCNNIVRRRGMHAILVDLLTFWQKFNIWNRIFGMNRRVEAIRRQESRLLLSNYLESCSAYLRLDLLPVAKLALVHGIQACFWSTEQNSLKNIAV